MADKRPTDVNALAARIVAEAVGDEPRTEPPAQDPGDDGYGDDASGGFDA
jgi:hypothetical protein